MIKAVILAGGKGTRLRPLTYKIPKPMIEINGKPFLKHQLLLLKRNGIEEMILLVGYLGGQIENYFKNGRKLGLRIKYSYEKEGSLLGTGGALKNAKTLLTDDFLLLNGDTYIDMDYQNLIRDFRKKGKDGMIVVTAKEFKKTLPGNINFDNKLRIVDYNKKGGEQLKFIDAGAAVYKKDILKMIPGGKPISLEEEIFPELIKAGELLAYPVNQPFYDMGTPKSLKILKRILQ